MTPQQMKDKWLRNVQGASQSYKEGVQSVTESPTAKAAAAEDRWAQGVQRALSDGSFRDGLGRVSLEDWKRATIEKGSARFTAGAQAGADKYAAFAADFLPFVQGLKRDLDATMPRGTPEQNEARMLEAVRRLRTFRRRR